MRRVGLAASLSVGMTSERHVEVVERSIDMSERILLTNDGSKKASFL